MAVQLLKGNVAFAEAAVRYGLQAYFGYPITPQSEALEHLSGRMLQEGRVFLQAESEVAAINMVLWCGLLWRPRDDIDLWPRFLADDRGPILHCRIGDPVVVVNMMRGGPGLGNIQPSQADYFLMTKTAGHGDFHPIVLAPASVSGAYR